MALFLYTKGFVQLQHDEKVSNAMDQVTLQISDNAQQALNFAFNEAQQRLNTMGQFDPFTVTVVDEGVEVNDHPASSPEGVRESVKMLVAQDMPEAYVLCYDGDVETDDGTLDCIVAEVADRGSADAYILVLLYTKDAEGFTFEADFVYAGPAPTLYPAGTKPIVSGLVALQREEGVAADGATVDFDADKAEEPESGEQVVEPAAEDCAE